MGLAPVAAAQSSTDSVKQRDGGPTRGWLSLGVGRGNSQHRGIAGRAALSIAANPVVLLTLGTTLVGDLAGSVNGINFMAGVRTPDPDGFLFASVGLATTSCSCASPIGIAIDGGFHLGGTHAGVGLVGFADFAPKRLIMSGVVGSIDLGRFGH